MKTYEEMLKENIGYIHTVAISLGHKNNEDLIQIGRIALRECYRKFDPTIGVTLMQYAGLNIRNKMINHLQRQNQLIHIPTPKQSSIKFTIISTQETTLDDILPDTIEDEPIAEDEKKLLYTAINQLKQNQQTIIKQYYGIHQPNEEGATLKAIAATRNTNDTNIYGIKERALKQLKTFIS